MPEVTSSADAKESNEDDFFSSWDKPAAAKTPTSSAPTTPPIVGRSSPLGNGAASAAPRTVTSSSLRSSSASSSRPASKLGASRLNSSNSSSTVSSTAASAAKKSKLGGLGAKKAVSPLDFAEAERKATEEAERIKQLGYDRLKEEEEERVRAKKAEEELKSSRSLGFGKVEKSNGAVPATVSKPRGTTQDMERLGMGMKKMGFGSVPAASAPASTRCGGCFIVRASLTLSVARSHRSTMLPPSLEKSSETRKLYLRTCTLGEMIMTRKLWVKHRTDCNHSRVLPPSHPTSTLAGKKRRMRVGR